MTGPTLGESLEATSEFYAATPRTDARPGIGDRPDGERVIVYGVRGSFRGLLEPGGTLWVDIADEDWMTTVLQWEPRGDRVCDEWCATGELDDMCPECAGAAHPDRDEVVEP